jgi:hypothetical protein
MIKSCRHKIGKGQEFVWRDFLQHRMKIYHINKFDKKFDLLKGEKGKHKFFDKIECQIVHMS